MRLLRVFLFVIVSIGISGVQPQLWQGATAFAAEAKIQSSDFEVNIGEIDNPREVLEKILLPNYPWLPAKYNAAGHQIDMVEVIDTAVKVQKSIEESVNFKSLKKMRPEPVNLKLRLMQVKLKPKESSSNSKGAEALRRSVQKAAENESNPISKQHEDFDMGDLRKLIAKNIVQRYRRVSSSGLDGLFVGLASAMPAGFNKGEYFKSPLEMKLRILRGVSGRVPFEELVQKVNFEKFPKLKTPKTWAHVLDWIDEQIQDRATLRAEIVALAMAEWKDLSDEGVTRISEIFELSKKLYRPFVDDLLSADSSIPSEVIKRLVEADKGQSDGQVFKELISRSLREVQNLYGLVPPPPKVDVQNEIKSVEVREASQLIALYRGFVANNCATACSASYVQIPTSRVFFLYFKGSKVPTGYVEVMRVNSIDGDKYLIHDLNGMGTELEASIVIEGLRKHFKEAEGMDTLLLDGTDSNHFNSYEFQEAVGKFNENTELVKIGLLDSNMRQRVTKFLGSNYYDSADNYVGKAKAIEEKIEKIFGSDHEVRYEASSSAAIAAESMDPTQRFLLEMDLATSRQLDPEKKKSITNEAVLETLSVLNNTGKLAIADYLSSAQTFLESKGITVNKDFRKKRAIYFSLGLLAAPDIGQPANRKLLAQAVEQVIRVAPDHKAIAKLYSKKELKDFWFELATGVRGMNLQDAAVVQAVYDNVPELREEILKSPIALGLLVATQDPRVTKSKGLKFESETPYSLPPPLVRHLVERISEDMGGKPLVITGLALDLVTQMSYTKLREHLGDEVFESLSYTLPRFFGQTTNETNISKAFEGLKKLRRVNDELLVYYQRILLSWGNSGANKPAKLRVALIQAHLAPKCAPTVKGSKKK